MIHMSSVYILLLYFQYILMFVSAIALIVIGIMIAANRVKPTRILGAAYIVSAVPSGLSRMTQLVARFFGVRILSRFSIVSTYLGGITSLVFALCICLFIHRRYGAKLIYIPVLAVPVTGNVANVIVAFALNRSGAAGITLSYWISLTQNVNNFVTGTVAAIAVIFVLYKNRKKEDIIPFAWIFRIFTYVWTVVSFVYRVITYLVMIAGVGVTRKNASPYMLFWAQNIEISNVMFTIIGCLESLIIPVYILIMVLKTSQKKQSAEITENSEAAEISGSTESIGTVE